jgi:MoxR-like ATPase
LKSIEEAQSTLGSAGYVADRRLATAVFLSLRLARPLFLEGEAGVGKTELAKALAASLGRPLIRLQCYEGLDVAAAVYEWNVQKQMTAIRIAEAAGGANREQLERDVFSAEYLIRRPILRALEEPTPPVLLIDELDRADEPFEAYLLEVLSDFQVTIPELGTIRAENPPAVVITSNRTREVHDAVKRRCLYHWVDYPDAARELEILRVKAPGASEQLSRAVVAFVQKLRTMDLYKAPGVAETIDWTRALLVLDTVSLDPQAVNATLGVLLKYQEDVARLAQEDMAALVQDAGSLAA